MKKYFRIVVLGGYCLTNTLLSNCQTKCEAGVERLDRPRMWFSKEEGQNRIRYFRLSKLPVLNHNSGVDQFGRINLGNFIGFLSYLNRFQNYKHLKIYIAMYDKEGSTNVPPYFGNQLTLVFSPVDKDGKDLNPNIFYMIPPNSYFDETRLTSFQVDSSKKNQLVRTYIDKMPLSTIDNGSPNNVCPGTPDCQLGVISDTRTVFYKRDALDELVKEQRYCHRDKNNNIDIILSQSMIAFFTAENRTTGPKENLRISVAFEFADLNYMPIDLEDTYHFNQRRTTIEKPVDNGQLCPTVCNP